RQLDHVSVHRVHLAILGRRLSLLRLARSSAASLQKHDISQLDSAEIPSSWAICLGEIQSTVTVPVMVAAISKVGVEWAYRSEQQLGTGIDESLCRLVSDERKSS